MGRKSWKPGILSALKDEKRDYQERMFLLQQLLLSGSMLILMLTGLLNGESADNLLSLLVAGGICLGIGALTTRYGHVQLFGTVCAALMIAVELPMTFFSSAGLRGGTPIWFVLCALCITQIITGWKKWALLIGQVVCIVLCYAISYACEDLVAPHTRAQTYVNSMVSVLLVCLAVSAIVSYEVYILRRALRRADAARRATERMNKAQNRFFSSMSHEIRTPVNAIISLNEMILREEISPEVEEDANSVRASCKLLLNVINDILDISKIESGNMEIVPIVYDTGDMFSELVGIFWTQAREKGLELKIDVDPEMPARLFGDEMRIRQVLSNLLSNAVKYTSEGHITLSVQPKHEGSSFSVVYSVSDTGKGIKKESIPYLFSAFKREDEELNKTIEGTGLGLSIVRQLVELMGGTVTVNSVYLKGSTFVVEIPQEQIGEEHIRTESIERRRTGDGSSYAHRFEAPGARILVVDDNRTNLMVVRKLLRSTGVELDTAESGAEALERTAEKQYHLIFMDHMMPEMDGIECLDRLKVQAGGLCRSARVVALTANAGSESRAFYAAAGFDGYLVKPLDSLALETECARLLSPELVTIDQSSDDEDEGFRVQQHQAREGVFITTDSVADLPAVMAERWHIGVIPSSVSTAGGVFRDGSELDADGLIEYMERAENFAFSQPPGKQAYELFFADALQHANNVVHIAMSSGVVGSGEPVAREAAETFENVTVIDSQSISGGLGLLAIEAGTCAQQGDAPEQIAAHIESLRPRIRCSFVVDSLDYLTRTRQINPVFHSLAETMMVHPVIQLGRGRLRLRRFLFGSRQTVWRRYIRSELRRYLKEGRGLLLVVYSGLSNDDLSLVRELVYRSVDSDNVLFQRSAPSITANCGKNSVGLFYLRSEQHPGAIR